CRSTSISQTPTSPRRDQLRTRLHHPQLHRLPRHPHRALHLTPPATINAKPSRILHRHPRPHHTSHRIRMRQILRPRHPLGIRPPRKITTLRRPITMRPHKTHRLHPHIHPTPHKPHRRSKRLHLRRKNRLQIHQRPTTRRRHHQHRLRHPHPTQRPQHH